MKTISLLKIIFFSILVFFTSCDLELPLDESANFARANNPLKVFILAGQSNMEGKGFVEPKSSHIDKNGGKGTLRYLYEKNKSQYKYLVDSSEKWAARDGVWLVDVSKQGPLKADFSGKSMGPELQFGHELGNYYKNNQVLLIKTAWGGKSLAVNFRPPSSGGQTGENYTMMIKRINEILGNIKKFYPDYNGQGYELVGFGWHQGWNDRVDEDKVDEYKENCVNLINDIRKDLKSDKLPFVLANTGMGGWKDLKPKAEQLMNDQMAVPKDSRIKVKDNIGAVETRDFYIDEKDSPNGFTFHWNCNAESYMKVGGAMGKMMIKILENGGLYGNTGGNTGGDENEPPVANFSYKINDLTVKFTNKSSDPENKITYWIWKFGDGQTSTTIAPSHTYDSSGTYKVTLEVTDLGGLSHSLTKSIKVSSGTTDPGSYDLIVNQGSGNGSYSPGEKVTIEADTPPEGEVFDKWVVISGKVDIEDIYSSETTITMPSKNVEIEATYKNSDNDLGCGSGSLPF